jgi:hypothetical protein
MTDIRTPDASPKQPGEARKQKKLYKKPEFRYERVFETNALSCGKVHPGPNHQCNSARKTS